MPKGRRQELVEQDNEALSVRRQCTLLSVNRSSVYYEAQSIAEDDVELLNEMRDIWEQHPFYGYRKITRSLKADGWQVNRKRVQRLMQQGGIKALYAKPKTSIKDALHRVYPYLLKGMDIVRANQVLQVDITYLRLGGGFMYLVALIDVYSRYVVGWSLSNTLDTESCVDALNQALTHGKPEIINSDQGCQFTSGKWTQRLIDENIKISMTGKGRCHDNIFIERFWRSFKQEAFYLHDHRDVSELKHAIETYVSFYNHARWHQSLSYETPAVFYGLAAPQSILVAPKAA